MTNTRIRTIPESAATGKLADIYADIRANFPGGIVPDVFEIVSLRPEFLRVVWSGYRAMFDDGVLPRDVKEMIAVVVSRTNSCRYCVQAHSLLLRTVGLASAAAVEAAAQADIDALPIDAKYKRLLDLTAKVTEHAYRVTGEDFVELRAASLSDDEILEGVFVASLFNAINRLADTFGLYDLMQLKEGGTPHGHPAVTQR
jgi:uncharacterized peroxidase-related enzyme